MKPQTIKSGETIFLFHPEPGDAARLIRYVKAVGDESDFLTFSGEEFNKSEEEEAAFIANHLSAPNQLILAAELHGEIAGLLTLSASPKPRLRHIGEFGITVRKAHWHKGIGSALLRDMIAWARASGIIRKVNLKVLTTNAGAIAAYRKLGFAIEGTLRRDFCLRGQFMDTYAMGLLID